MDGENQNPQSGNSASQGPQSTPPMDPLSGPASGTPAPAQHPLDAPAPKSNPTDGLGLPGETLQAARKPEVETQEEPGTLANIASGFASVFAAIFSWIIFPIAVVLILHNFVFQAYHVLGTSMVPTLHNTDYLIVSKLGYTETELARALGHNSDYIPKRGEIIVFHYPKDPTKIFVKRVVGLPGDHVVIKNGSVTIYDSAHPGGFNPDVNYEPSGTQTLIDTDVVVQPVELFVMGDNRTPGGSFDSREWGELPSSYIIGNVVMRLLPLDQVKIF
ncbi:MAG TPA: signal peptidase I [Puia sp.]|nr:signal peptidase I [Puia sp.]